MKIFNFLKVGAKFFAKALRFIGNVILSIFAWFLAISTYAPILFVIYALSFGIDFKKMPNLRGFVKIFKFFVKSFLFPTEAGIRTLGHIVVLPFLKAEREENNPISSTYSKYLNSLINGKEVTINHEYIDGIHRKHNYFILFSYFGASLIYFLIVGFWGEISSALSMVSFMTGGIAGMDFINGNGIVSHKGMSSMGVFAMVTMFSTMILNSLITNLGYIFAISGSLCAFWGFREMRTQNNISSFVAESVKLLHLSLCENFKNDEKMIENLNKSFLYTKESVILPKSLNDEFVAIGNTLQIANDLKRLQIENN